MAERFSSIYESHYRDVLAYLRRRTTADVAADLAADTFLVAWRRLEDVPDNPLPWLLGVARRTLANQRRGARRGEALANRLQEHEGPAAVVHEVGSDDAVLLALAGLSEADRELLALTAWEGLSPREAAEALGVSCVTVRVRLHRAKRRLATALAPGHDFSSPLTRASQSSRS